MRTWKRATTEGLCGGCGRSIVGGDPVLELAITLGGSTSTVRKVRCAACAGEPMPADLPPRHEPGARLAPSRLTRFTPDMLPLDFKRAAGGDR